MKKKVSFIIIAAAVMSGGVLLFSKRVLAQYNGARRIPPGTVAAHVIGRLLVAPDGTGQMYGYLPFLEGLPAPPFAGAVGEKTAYFTFRSAQFNVQVVPNGSINHLFTIPINDTAVGVSLYFNPSPNQDFTNPASFSAGQPVATLRTHKGMATVITGASTSEVGSLELVSATPFTFQGQVVNVQDVLSSITLFTYYTATPSSGTLLQSPATFPFGGTAIVNGNAALPRGLFRP
jgi:hypothetical protein